MAPQDVMHVILEGALSHETRLFLRHCVAQGFFTIGQLNSAIDRFPYGYSERYNKPSAITQDQLNAEHTVLGGQKASQMWLLARVLLLLIDNLVAVNDPHRVTYRLHIAILYRAMACEVHPTTAASLANLIEIHHLLFRITYPGVSITPKLHYYLHIPTILLRDGPARWVCCLRYEAKHQRLTEFFGVSNHINQAKIMCRREERLQAARFATIPGHFPPDLLGDTHLDGLAPVPPGDPIHVVMQVAFGGPVPALQFCNQATIDGTEFKAERCVVRRVAMQPTYIFLTAIVEAGQQTFFVGRLVDVLGFRERVQLYEVAHTHNLVVVEIQHCITVHAIMLWEHGNSLYLSDRTSDRTFF